MKKKIIIGLATLVAIIGISLLTFKPEPAQAKWCSFGYSSTTAWKGNCYNCYCGQWNYTGRDQCPPVEPE